MTTVEEAKKIINESEMAKRKADDEKLCRQSKALVGRFFKNKACMFADEDGFEIFYVRKTGFQDYYNSVETWIYAHDGHYKVDLITWYGDHDLQYLLEINEIEYYNLVVKFLKKIGAYQTITQETNH